MQICRWYLKFGQFERKEQSYGKKARKLIEQLAWECLGIILIDYVASFLIVLESNEVHGEGFKIVKIEEKGS